MKRRSFLRDVGALSMLSFPAASRASGRSAPHVIVVGGGFGGATAAKYLRLFSKNRVRVTLIDPDADFVSCPMSNLVLQGRLSMPDITVSYANLRRRHGVAVIRDYVRRIDAPARRVVLKSGGLLAYDRVVVSPGIDFMWDRIPGMASPRARENILAAWKGGPEIEIGRANV